VIVVLLVIQMKADAAAADAEYCCWFPKSKFCFLAVRLSSFQKQSPSVQHRRGKIRSTEIIYRISEHICICY